MTDKPVTTARIRDLYRGATGWRWDDGEGQTDLSELREQLGVEFDTWLEAYTVEVRAAVRQQCIADALEALDVVEREALDVTVRTRGDSAEMVNATWVREAIAEGRKFLRTAHSPACHNKENIDESQF